MSWSGPWGTSAVPKGAHSGVRGQPLSKEGTWSNADTCGRRGVKELGDVRKLALFYYYSSMFCGRSLFVMSNYKS